jgi:hypothetical protein
MIDRLTGEPVNVRTDSNAGPYMIVESEASERVEAALRLAGITFGSDSEAVRLDGQNAATTFNFGNGTDVAAIQEVLDNLE